jgi:hypothetical protein
MVIMPDLSFSSMLMSSSASLKLSHVWVWRVEGDIHSVWGKEPKGLVGTGQLILSMGWV